MEIQILARDKHTSVCVWGGGASSCDPHILLCKYCRYNIVNPNNLEQSAL